MSLDLWRASGAVASSPAASRIARGNPGSGTQAEVRLRSLLHRRGLRFRKGRTIPLRPEPGKRRRWTRPDVTFPRERVCVYVDGCFWHRCPEHFHAPKANSAYWGPKIAANVRRDRDTVAQLERLGWRVLRAWEHEDPVAIADRVEAAVRARRGSNPQPCVGRDTAMSRATHGSPA